MFGAFDGDTMVGFCFAIPGIKPGGQPYLHSHMLGVLPEYRNAGVGRQLKLQQREEALARGIQLIEWTFDPLELKNAYLQYRAAGRHRAPLHENQYGITSSPLHGGLPTDRCYAEWWIGFAARAAASWRASRRRHDGAPPSASPIPPTSRASAAKIRARAREIQQAQRAKNSAMPSRSGLAVTGFERGEHRRQLSAGAMAMKIERVTLRQIRMPLVHFFETSFGRTTERHIILVEVQATAFPAGAK